jgi:hypothetical protein
LPEQLAKITGYVDNDSDMEAASESETELGLALLHSAQPLAAGDPVHLMAPTHATPLEGVEIHPDTRRPFGSAKARSLSRVAPYSVEDASNAAANAS